MPSALHLQIYFNGRAVAKFKVIIINIISILFSCEYTEGRSLNQHRFAKVFMFGPEPKVCQLKSSGCYILFNLLDKCGGVDIAFTCGIY